MTPPSLAEIDRLLVVKTSSIGDVLHALPVVEAIKNARPQMTLDWIVRARCADVLRGNPSIDHLYVIENRPSVSQLFALRRTLRAARYQLALDIQGLALSGILTWLSHAPVRVGWNRNREMNGLFLTDAIVDGKPPAPRHEIDLLWGFAETFGIPARRGEYAPQSYLAADNRTWAREKLASLPGAKIALNVGASRAYKRWPTERWTALARDLTAAGTGIVFVGDARDAKTVAEIKASLTNEKNVADVSGQTDLRQLAAILEACDMTISGDSGPMHLSVAVGTPVIALFGATNPARHSPYGTRNVIVQNATPTQKRPTEAEGAAAMAAIGVGDVMNAVKEKLA